LTMVATDQDVPLIEDIGANEIQTIINDGRVEAARKVLEVHLMPHLSQDSRHYLSVATANIENYSLNSEWTEAHP